MSLTLLEVFDKAFEHVKFDANLARAFYRYQIGYLNKSKEHLEFFGGNLLGVQIIRFKDSDVLKIFDEILDVDYYSLTALIRQVPTINHEYKVSGDILNLSCMYAIHRFLNSPSLNDTQKQRAAYDVALIFFYRCVAAITSDWVKYPFDPKIAQAAYARLSNKHLIKKLGSWFKVMDYRANDLVDMGGIHRQSLVQFNDDVRIVYCINDSQGRVRDLLKNYYAEFIRVHKSGDSIATTQSTYLDADGEEVNAEKTKSVESYVTYMTNCVVDKNSFVREDLVGVINKLNNNTSMRMIRHTLTWMCDNYTHTMHKDISEFITLIIVHSMHLIQYNVVPKNPRDYPYILLSLKNLYLSTRSTDPELEKIRELGMKIVTAANGKCSASLLMSTRTSIILYITLRALTGKNR